MARKPSKTKDGSEAVPNPARSAAEEFVYSTVATYAKVEVGDLKPTTIIRGGTGKNADPLIAWNIMERLEAARPELRNKINGINDIVPLTVQDVVDAVRKVLG